MHCSKCGSGDWRTEPSKMDDFGGYVITVFCKKCGHSAVLKDTRKPNGGMKK